MYRFPFWGNTVISTKEKRNTYPPLFDPSPVGFVQQAGDILFYLHLAANQIIFQEISLLSPYSSFRRLTARLKRSIPTQGIRTQVIPAAIPAFSDTSPISQRIRIAPLLAAGSIIPMLVTLVIRPALATAVGFIPAIEKAKAKSNSIAAFWEWESMSPI